MASETSALAHSEEVEKKVESEVKKVEAAEESLCPDESKAKTEENQAKTPVVEEVKVVDVDENPKAEDKVETTVDKAEDKPAEPVADEEPGKTKAAPLPEPTEEKIDSEPVELSAEEKIKSKPVESSAEEKIEHKPVESLAEEKIESTPVESSAEEKIGSIQVEPLAQEKIESTPVEPSTEAKIEKKPVEPLVEEKIENTPVEPLAEEKIEGKLVEPSAEELKPANVAESISDNIEDVPVQPCLAEDKRNTGVAELTENKFEDKPVEPPIKEEEKKSEDAPIVEPSDKGVQEVTKEAVAELDTVSISGSGIEKADRKVEERSEPEHDENKVEEPKAASIDDDSAKACDVPELPPAEAVEEKVEEVVIKHKEAAVSVDDCKPGEQSEVVKQIEKDTLEVAPVENAVAGDEVADVKLAKEEEVDAAKSLDQVKPESPVEEKDVACYPAEALDKNSTGSELEEEAKGTAEVKESSETQDANAEKVEAKADEERSEVAEELVSCDEKTTKDAISSIPPPEKAAEEIDSRGIEQSVENGTSKDQTLTSAEVAENSCEGAAKELDKTEATEEKEEAEEATEAKVEEEKQVDKILEESVQATEAKLEEAKQVDEPTKTDVQNAECTKDAEETKADHLKEDIPVKSQKPSIVKMMKQSLVKAKKAIIGKSQNSKTLVQEQTKG